MHAKLQKMIDIAKKIGGENHGFRFVMVPVNYFLKQLSMGTPETILKWQEYQIGKEKSFKSVFDIASA